MILRSSRGLAITYVKSWQLVIQIMPKSQVSSAYSMVYE